MVLCDGELDADWEQASKKKDKILTSTQLFL